MGFGCRGSGAHSFALMSLVEHLRISDWLGSRAAVWLSVTLFQWDEDGALCQSSDGDGQTLMPLGFPHIFTMTGPQEGYTG